jgi:hypothetical protein
MNNNSPTEKKLRKNNNSVDIQIKNGGVQMRRPPMEDLLFNIKLKNVSIETKWVIIPSSIQTSHYNNLDNHTVQLYKICGQGCMNLAKFIGDKSNYVIRIQPNAEIEIQELPITFWVDEDKIVETVQIEITIAEEIYIENLPFQIWSGIEWISNKIIKVKYTNSTIIDAKYKPDLKTIPVTILNAIRSDFKLII